MENIARRIPWAYLVAALFIAGVGTILFGNPFGTLTTFLVVLAGILVSKPIAKRLKAQPATIKISSLIILIIAGMTISYLKMGPITDQASNFIMGAAIGLVIMIF